MTLLRAAVLLSAAVAAPVALTSCHDHHDDHVVVVVTEPTPVALEIEVFDPVTGFVWENVGVRIVEVDHEWSGCLCPHPRPDEFVLTDRDGRVFLDAFDLADAEVGFAIDIDQRAVIGPRSDEDEAYVLVEVWSPGFAAVQVEVPLSWAEPFGFASIPFEE